MRAKSTIGSNILIDVADFKDVPAKVDTGADSSAIWASDINVTKNHVLEFKLFGPKSEFYTGESIRTKDFNVAVVRSAHGDEQIRYRTKLSAKINGRKIKILFNLADRSRNQFPILIGRRTIKNKYIVDVSEKAIKHAKITKTIGLNKKLQQNPYEFHQKYVKSKEKGAVK